MPVSAADNSSLPLAEVVVDDDLSDDDRDLLIYGVVIPLLCLAGLVGNTLNIAVLRSYYRPCPPGSGEAPSGAAHNMYTYLTWLSVADLLLMVAWLPVVARDGWRVEATSVAALRYFVHLAFPVINCLMATSSYLVAAITVERFLCVCFPLRRYEMKRRYLVLATGLSFLLPVLLYIPTMAGKHVQPHHNATTHHTIFTVEKASYKGTVVYEYVYNVIKILLTVLAPLLLIVILNACTIKSFHRFVSENKSLFSDTTGGCEVRCEVERRRYQQEYHLTILLLAIILLYTVCMVPHALFHLLHYSLPDHDQDAPAFQNYRATVNILGVLNSALNFYLYCLAAPRYQAQFKVVVSGAVADFYRYCACAVGRLVYQAQPSPPASPPRRYRESQTLPVTDVEHIECASRRTSYGSTTEQADMNHT